MERNKRSMWLLVLSGVLIVAVLLWFGLGIALWPTATSVPGWYGWTLFGLVSGLVLSISGTAVSMILDIYND